MAKSRENDFKIPAFVVKIDVLLHGSFGLSFDTMIPLKKAPNPQKFNGQNSGRI